MQKGWKYSAVELDGNEKLAWMPSGNKQRRLTWPVMRYSVRRRMRQLHFHPAFKQDGKIFWIQMLPSHTGNVIRGQSLAGCWSFSMKFMPLKKKKTPDFSIGPKRLKKRRFKRVWNIKSFSQEGKVKNSILHFCKLIDVLPISIFSKDVPIALKLSDHSS